MKTNYLLAACLTIAALSGCATNGTPAPQPDPEPAQATTVLRYSSSDIAALPLGEFLRFDLTVPNTAYALTYTSQADLEHVMVLRSDSKYILADQPPADSSQSNTEKQVVLSADDLLDPSIQPAVVCNCPCCQLVDGSQVCC